MKHSRLLPILVAFTLISCSPSPEEPSAMDPATAHEWDTVRQAAKTFYSALRKERIEGLPSAEQMKRLAPLMTPELGALLTRARELQQEQMRREPDAKPDWIEGDLFGSLFEGATDWEVVDVFSAPTVDAIAKIKLTYGDKNQEPVSWTDTLVFKQKDGRWLLDDIRMGGKWAFKSGDSLRARLPGGGKDEADHGSPDGRWRIVFVRDGEAVKAITIRSVAEPSAKPVVLYGSKGEAPCAQPTWVVWGPACDRLAIRLGEGPHFTRTLVYLLTAGGWKKVPLPEFYPEEKKTMTGNGFTEIDRLIDAEYWRDAETLVVKYFGSFTNKEDGDGYYQYIAVHIGADGASRILDAVDVPGGD